MNSNIISNIFKEVVSRKATASLNTAKRALAKDITTTITDPINTTANTIINAPTTLKQELQRQSFHEASNLFNIGNYDYWGEYYSSYNKRATPTPSNNLAEMLWLRESHNRKVRGY